MRELLQSVAIGDLDAFDELTQQTCHQGSVSEVAFAAVPHLVEIARAAPATERSARALVLVGWIVASREIDAGEPCPPDLETDYSAALPVARALAAGALQSAVEDPIARWLLFGALAALHQQPDLAYHMMLSGPDLSCPECGEPIRFRVPR
ncbi:MAG: hypothetical protein M3Y87_08225 [Myxococcota bacterium]|nr:hypothetical protein [Myxococcota bacterium]